MTVSRDLVNHKNDRGQIDARDGKSVMSFSEIVMVMIKLIGNRTSCRPIRIGNHMRPNTIKD